MEIRILESSFSMYKNNTREKTMDTPGLAIGIGPVSPIGDDYPSNAKERLRRGGENTWRLAGQVYLSVDSH